jgi:2-methylcitrate dehydratase PrpD
MTTEELAEYVAAYEPTPDDLHAAADSLLDTRCAAELGAAGRLAGQSFATRARADAFDDWVGYGAAGAPVWGALLALGGEPEAMLEAGCAGIAGALAAWRGYREADRGFDGTGVFGTLAAALAGARLLALSPAQIAGALGIAASQAAGVVGNLGTDMDALHAGQAARSGELAARLAKRGYRGSREILEGRQGFDEAFFGLRPDTPLVPVALAGELHVKHVPGHPGHQAAVRALQQLRHGATAVVADGIASTSGAIRFDEPRTPGEARASLRFALACTLAHGTVLPRHHADPASVSCARVRVDVLSRWQRERARVTVDRDDGTNRSLALAELDAAAPDVSAKWEPFSAVGRIGAVLESPQDARFLLR